jgi:hypothetical protein
MRIDSSGNVGIGTSSSDFLLTVGANLNNSYGISTTNSLLAINPLFHGVGSGIPTLTLHRDDVTTFTNDDLGRIYFSGADGDAIGSYIGSTAANNWSTGSTGANLIFATRDTVLGASLLERMRIDSSGNVLVGTTSNAPRNFTGGTYGVKINKTQSEFAQNTMFINRSSATNGDVVVFRKEAASVGSISLTAVSTAYNTSSDYRLKENVVPMTGALDRVDALKPARFNFIADADKTVDGFLAHEVQDIVPEAVTGIKDAMREEEYEVEPAVLDDEGNVITEAVMGTRSVPDYQGIDQSKLVPLLVGAIQEQQSIINDLITRIEKLEK